MKPTRNHHPREQTNRQQDADNGGGGGNNNDLDMDRYNETDRSTEQSRARGCGYCEAQKNSFTLHGTIIVSSLMLSLAVIFMYT